MSLSSIEQAIKAVKKGEYVIIVDDAERENEGDLFIAAEKITAENINFMATHARGLICVPMLPERLEELRIPLMVRDNATPLETAFTDSVDAKVNVSTGISAGDRAVTVEVLIDPSTRPDDLGRPGHVFPLRYREGGVLMRAGHTEAAVDLAKISGLYPAGVICEIMNDDGSMARMDDLEKYSKKYFFGKRVDTQKEEFHKIQKGCSFILKKID